MTYHVHSLHVRSVKVTSGTYTLDGQTRIPSPPPLHEAETFGDAEAWRLGELEKVKAR
jgi:hypothetical protein